MRRTWPFLLALSAVGIIAGVLIAGLPHSSPTFTIDPSRASTTSSSLPLVLPTQPDDHSLDTIGPTTTEAPTALTTTTSTAPTSSTTSSTTSTTIAVTTTTAPAVDRATLRLVVANADGRAGLASANANRLTALGYGSINLGDSPDNIPLTIIYYRDGFLTSAAMVSADLGLDQVPLVPLPTDQATPLTNSDQFGDVIVLLGADAVK